MPTGPTSRCSWHEQWAFSKPTQKKVSGVSSVVDSGDFQNTTDLQLNEISDAETKWNIKRRVPPGTTSRVTEFLERSDMGIHTPNVGGVPGAAVYAMACCHTHANLLVITRNWTREKSQAFGSFQVKSDSSLIPMLGTIAIAGYRLIALDWGLFQPSNALHSIASRLLTSTIFGQVLST